jgi:hypothetical protein
MAKKQPVEAIMTEQEAMAILDGPQFREVKIPVMLTAQEVAHILVGIDQVYQEAKVREDAARKGFNFAEAKVYQDAAELYGQLFDNLSRSLERWAATVSESQSISSDEEKKSEGGIILG